MPVTGATGVKRSMIRLMIVADIRLYREGLAQVLARGQRSLEVVAAAASLDEAMILLPTLLPDVVLVDAASPGALPGIRCIVESFPSVNVVALGVAEADSAVLACAEAGVAGYVVRDGSVEDLVASVESAARGELRCTPRVAATLLRQVARLATERGMGGEREITPRERQILDLVDQGLSNKEIASHLFIEVATVKNHIHNILEKLGVRRRGEAAARMRRRPDSWAARPL